MRLPLRGAAALLVLFLAPTGALGETLSPDAALTRAAKKNPTLRAAMHDLAAARHALEGADHARDPVLFLGTTGQYNESFSGSSRGISRNDNESITADGGVRYTTPIGTALEVGTSNGVSWRSTNIDPSTTESVTIGPNYQSEVFANARQPLLKGAGTDAVLAPVNQAEAQKTQAEQERDQTASQLTLDVLSAYWELWYAERAVAVQEAALTLAEGQQQQAQAQLDLEVANVAGVDVLRFATEVASIRESLSNARATRTTRALELGRLLGMKPRRSRALASDAAGPTAPALPPLDALIAEAHESSPELRALQAQIDSARIAVDSAEDQALPQLDLIASVAMAGLWNSDTITTLALPGDRPAFTALLGIEIEVPLGPGSGSPNAARARSQLRAAEARYDASVQALDADIAAVHVELESSAQSVELAGETAAIAAKLAQAERDRLALGTTTPLELVRAQQSEREAQLRALRAQVDHALAALRLEHQSGMLLPRVASKLHAPKEG